MALDPERSLKAEKTAVIADTIKVLGSIRSENDQLRHEKEELTVSICKFLLEALGMGQKPAGYFDKP